MNTLKPLMEWAIALRRRLTHDIFFSTRIKIAVCLVLFVAVIIVGFVVLVEYVKLILMTGIVEALTLAISEGINDPSIIITMNGETATAVSRVRPRPVQSPRSRWPPPRRTSHDRARPRQHRA